MPLADPSQTTMAIVAHPDDDLLFMNPDIRSSIEAGGGHTSVFLTAGDAGYGEVHWTERELGIKAAYGDMAGSSIWVDQLIQLSDGARTIELHASHLESQPEVQVYFLRLPDGNPGGGGYSVTGNQSLALLWEGGIATANTVDGADAYSRADVLRILDALMEHHAPETVMMQDYQSEHADEEHSDHQHAAHFAHTALSLYSLDHDVQAHINYATEHLPVNLSHAEYAESAENFSYYADHDFTMYHTPGPDGVPLFGDPLDAWLQRQYTFDPGEGPLADLGGLPDLVVLPDALPDPDAPPPDDGLDYALEGPDAFLFQVDQDTGEITPQDWFVPSVSDAWDQNEDHVYELTRITTGEGLDAPVAEGFEMHVDASGITWHSVEGGPIDPPPDPDPVPDPDPDPDPVPDPDPDPDPVPPTGVTYAIEGPDAYLFQVDQSTGEITTQAWFSPSLADAWDQGEDHVYEVTRITDDPAATDPLREDFEMRVTETGVEWSLAGEVADPTPSPAPDPDPDPVPDPGPTDPPANYGVIPGTGGAPVTGLSYDIEGPDVFLFQVETDTGAVSPKAWFQPDPDDPWDQGEDNVYDLVLVARDDLSGASTRTDLSFTPGASGWEVLNDAEPATATPAALDAGVADDEMSEPVSDAPVTSGGDSTTSGDPDPGTELMHMLYQLYFPDFDPVEEDVPEELDGVL